MSINFFFHIIRFFQCGKNRDFVEIFIHIFAMPVKDQIPGDNKQQTFKMVIFTKKFTRFPYFDKDFLLNISEKTVENQISEALKYLKKNITLLLLFI